MLPKFKAVPIAKSREMGFVHVTKTGGTAVKDHMLMHRSECPKVKFTSGHLDLEKDWQRKGYQSLVVLRDPVDRFRSAFDYAKSGFLLLIDGSFDITYSHHVLTLLDLFLVGMAPGFMEGTIQQQLDYSLTPTALLAPFVTPNMFTISRCLFVKKNCISSEDELYDLPITT